MDINNIMTAYRNLGYLCEYEDVARELGCDVKEVQRIMIDCMQNDIDKFLELMYNIWRASKKAKEER